jgi:hypothetical protein
MAIRKPINMAFPFACRERPPRKVEWVFLQPIPQPNALHSRRHDGEVQLYAFDCLTLDGEDLRTLPLSMRKTNLARLLARRPDGIFVAPFEQGEIGPDLFRAARGGGVLALGVRFFFERRPHHLRTR